MIAYVFDSNIRATNAFSLRLVSPECTKNYTDMTISLNGVVIAKYITDDINKIRGLEFTSIIWDEASSFKIEFIAHALTRIRT